MDFPDTIIFDNTVGQWGLAAAVFVLTLLILLLLKRLISKHLADYAERTHTYVDDILAAVVGHTKTVFILLVALWAGSLFLDLPPEVRMIRRIVVIITWLIQIGLWSNGVINYWIDTKAEEQPEDSDRATTLNAFGMIAKTVIWVILVLLMLDNLPGVDVSTLIDFNHAYFKGFGDSALNFEVLYHVETKEFSVYREIMQAVNFDLFNRLEAEGIKFAYPTQTVYVEK